jgi:hypothetical protein
VNESTSYGDGLSWYKMVFMKTLWVVFLTVFIAQCAVAQDERYLRGLLSGDLSREYVPEEVRDYHFKSQSPVYQLDLTGDHRNESLIVEKKDGEDWLHIHDYHMNRVSSHRFQAVAGGSKIYRLRLVTLSNQTRLLLIHFYEGVNSYLQTRANARFYFLTIDDGDLKTASVYRGPAYWEEFQENRDYIHRRKYNLEFADLTRDGKLEIRVFTNLISYVYHYHGKGRWIEIK